MLDLIIVGNGPAGLQAAIYAASEGLSTLVLGYAHESGGMIRRSPFIENLGGYPNGITGHALSDNLVEQARKMGATFAHARANGIETGRVRVGGGWVSCRAAILATGLKWHPLDTATYRIVYRTWSHWGPPDVRREESGNKVLVVGGKNAAAQSILWLADRYKRVDVLTRSGLGASKYLQDRIDARPSIRPVTLEEAGRTNYDRVYLCNGTAPNTDWLLGSGVKLTDTGHVVRGGGFATGTTLDGVFAAGDILSGSTSRAAAAMGSGAAAVTDVWSYLRR